MIFIIIVSVYMLSLINCEYSIKFIDVLDFRKGCLLDGCFCFPCSRNAKRLQKGITGTSENSFVVRFHILFSLISGYLINDHFAFIL